MNSLFIFVQLDSFFGSKYSVYMSSDKLFTICSLHFSLASSIPMPLVVVFTI